MMHEKGPKSQNVFCFDMYGVVRISFLKGKTDVQLQQIAANHQNHYGFLAKKVLAVPLSILFSQKYWQYLHRYLKIIVDKLSAILDTSMLINLMIVTFLAHQLGL